MLAQLREEKRNEAEHATRKPSAGALPPIIKEALKDEAKESDEANGGGGEKGRRYKRRTGNDDEKR